jgi:signal peptidase II
MTPPPAPDRRRFAAPLLSAAVLAAADQGAKAWAVKALAPYQPVAIVPGWFDLVHVRNHGVAFSLMSNLDHRWVHPLLIAATVLAVGALVAYLWLLPGKGAAPYGLGLILGGAVGNLIDRARLGYVVDFLDLHWRSHHWPTFNVADIGITVGVALLLADMLFGPREAHGPDSAPTRKR